METHTSLPKKLSSLSTMLTARLSAIGCVAGRWISMRVERIGVDALFLLAKEYVRPRSGLEVLVWIDGAQKPLHFMLSAVFVERTWAGFGIAARITKSSADHQMRLTQLYKKASAQALPAASETARRNAFFAQQQLVVQEHALPNSVLNALQQKGIRIHIAQAVQHACELAERGNIHLILWTENDATQDGRNLCRLLAELPEPPRSVLVTGRGTAQDFESSLYAGATMVLARPCELDMLLIRILDLLQAPKPAKDDAETAAVAHPRKSSARTSWPASVFEQVSDQFASFLLSTRVFFRSSTYQRLSVLTFS